MSTTGWIILIVTILVLVAMIVGIVFLYKKAKKNQEAQEVAMEANKQTLSMLIIDKKRMRIKDSGLPQSVIDQTPKMMRRSKLPIVKAKVGPKVMSLIADEAVYDLIPLKKEVKATVSGIERSIFEACGEFVFVARKHFEVVVNTSISMCIILCDIRSKIISM